MTLEIANPPATSAPLVPRRSGRQDPFSIEKDRALTCDALVEKYCPVLQSFCFKIASGTAIEAKDLYQDVAVKIIRNFKNFNWDCSFLTWSYRIAYTTFSNSIRDNKKHFDCVRLDDTHFSAGSNDDESPTLLSLLEAKPSQSDPHLMLAKELTQRKLVLILVRFAEETQSAPRALQVLRLRYVDDMSYEEVALVLGTTLGTIKSSLHRSTRRITEIAKTITPADVQKMPDIASWRLGDEVCLAQALQVVGYELSNPPAKQNKPSAARPQKASSRSQLIPLPTSTTGLAVLQA